MRSPVIGDMTHCSEGTAGTAPAFAEKIHVIKYIMIVYLRYRHYSALLEIKEQSV